MSRGDAEGRGGAEETRKDRGATHASMPTQRSSLGVVDGENRCTGARTSTPRAVLRASARRTSAPPRETPAQKADREPGSLVPPRGRAYVRGSSTTSE